MEFIGPLPNLEIVEKQGAVFECEVSKPNQTAQWQQNVEVITPGVGDWERFSTDVDGCVHRLTVSHSKMEDAAKYSCHIKDKKTTGKLTVKG